VFQKKKNGGGGSIKARKKATDDEFLREESPGAAGLKKVRWCKTIKRTAKKKGTVTPFWPKMILPNEDQPALYNRGRQVMSGGND